MKKIITIILLCLVPMISYAQFAGTWTGVLTPTKVIYPTNLNGSVPNVGIGTTSPYAKLSVVGQVVGSYYTATTSSADSIFAGTLSVGTSTANTAKLNVTANTTDGSTISQRWLDAANTARAYVASNGDSFFNSLSLASLTNGPVKSSTGVLINEAIDLTSTEVTGALPVTKGGTGLSTLTTGDLLYSSASNTLSPLAIGSASDILTISGGVPAWSSRASLLDSQYLRLDTTNNPLTGNLTIAKESPVLTFTDNSSASYATLTVSNTDFTIAFGVGGAEIPATIMSNGTTITFVPTGVGGLTFAVDSLSFLSGFAGVNAVDYSFVGDPATGGSNLDGGDMNFGCGASTGSGKCNINFKVTGGGASGSTSRTPYTIATVNQYGLGIGTTTSLAHLQATASSTNATTSIVFGKSNQNVGPCLTFYDAAGSPVYMYIAAGGTTFTAQNGGTAPSGCTN